jgi:quercetin dioxygenase-like cupin family protein
MVHPKNRFLVLLGGPKPAEDARIPKEVPTMKIARSIVALLAVCTTAFAGSVTAHAPGEAVKPNFSQALPNVPGKSLIAVEVTYAPGAASAPHTHAKSAFIYAYVVSGEIASQVDDGPERVYKAGESFHEEPGAHHRISRNASATQPAKLLAVFVVDSGDTHLTTPDA